MGSPVEMGDRKKVDFFKLRRSKRSEKVVIANQHQGFRQLNHMYMYVYVIMYIYIFCICIYCICICIYVLYNIHHIKANCLVRFNPILVSHCSSGPP